MPRNSRHKSHRMDRHGSRDGRDRSESEEDGGSSDRKQRAEEPAAGLGARVSRDLDPEKRKSSSASQPHRGNNDQVGPDSGDLSARKKRKYRVENSSATDRWGGGGEDDGMVGKQPTGEALGSADSERAAKSKVSSIDSKGRSTRRHEGPTERSEESGVKVESGKHRTEKDSSRRGSSGQHKDAKERDKERGSERDKNALESRYERSDDRSSRNQGAKTGSSEAEGVVNKDKENTEWQIQDELRNPELEEELEKRIRKRDGSGDKDKWKGDSREGDDRQLRESDDRQGRESDDRRHRESDDRRHRENDDKRLSSRDDHGKSRSYKDERYKDEKIKDGRYSRDMYQDDHDRERRHREDRHHDEHSRDCASDRYDNRHIKDDRPLESRHEKTKLQNHDHDGDACIEDHGTRFKDIGVRKRSSNGNEDHSDLKLRSTKQPRGDVKKSASDTSKLDSPIDKSRSDYRHPNKVDSSLSDNRPKSSPRSSSHAVKDQSRYRSKQTHKESPSQERFRSSAASTDHASISGVVERNYESWSRGKTKPKDSINLGELILEVAAVSQYDRTPRSDGHVSPINSTEKSTSSTSYRRYSRRSGARQSLDIEDMGQISSPPKDGRDYTAIDDREHTDNQSQSDLQTSKHITVGSSSLSRAGQFFGSSPGHLPPRTPVRPRFDSPSVLGPFEIDNRYQTGDRKSNSRYKRNDDYNTGRAQGNTWMSTPSRPLVHNGFIPFQHGLLPPGFHSALQQFPSPSLYGIRHMDMNSTGVSYHMHEAADRFFSHGLPFGLCNPLNPQLQGWDGSNGVFGDESHVYGRAEWNQNRHPMGSRGLDIGAGMWKGQNGNVNMEFPVPQKEPEFSSCASKDDAWAAESGHGSHTERAHLECGPDERTGIKRSGDTPSAKNAAETIPKTIHEKTTEPSKTPDDDTARNSCTYLSKLDISLDLTCPELYKQCMTLMGTRDPPGVSSFSRHGCPQNVKDATKAAAKSSKKNLISLFPEMTDVFQKAVSLYKRQKEATKVKVPVLPGLSKEAKNHPETSGMEKVQADDHQASEETSEANNACCSPTNMIIEEEGNNAINDVEGADVPDDANLISDAVVFVENPQECEGVGVNLSRILNSPESTH